MLIDVHAHAAVEGLPYEDGKSRLLRIFEAYHFDKMYISNFMEAVPTKEQVEEGNRYTAALIKEHPDKFGGYVYVSPEHDNAVEVFKRGIEEQGLEGVKLWLSCYCDDVCVNRIAELAIDYGTPMLIHTFHKSTWQYPNESVGKHVANLAKRYPELKIIMAHLGGNCYNGIPMIRDLKNVWVDFSGSMFHGDAIDYTVENIGAERLLFGTDAPWFFVTNIGKVLGAKLTDEERNLVFYKNAQKIFDRNFKL